MRKIVIFTTILTLFFTMVGCTAHSESDEKAAESSSSNALIDTTQAEKLSEKTENEAVEKSIIAEEKSKLTIAETYTEKVSKEPFFSQTTTKNNEPKQDAHTQKETPKSEKSECWDNPISANASNKNIGADIESRLNRYKNTEEFSSVWIWVEKLSDTQYEIYIGYA